MPDYKTEWLQLRQGELVHHRVWTGAELATATKLRAEGYSAAYIGNVLGRTRNAVIAELWRAEVRPPENVRPHRKDDPRPSAVPRAPVVRRFSFEDA